MLNEFSQNIDENDIPIHLQKNLTCPYNHTYV